MLRVGIAGAGLMGYWHAAYAPRAGGKLLAVVDTDLETAKRVAGKHRGAQSFADTSEMLREVEIDVLHVCTPLETHFEITEAAFGAGVHVLLEKPMTATAPETERLYELAKERGLSLCPVHQLAFQNGVSKAHNLLGHIGEIVHLEASFHSAGGVGLPPKRLDAIAADILPHPLSLFLLLLKGGLEGASWIKMRPAAGELRIIGGTSGTTMGITISMRARPTKSDLKIFGSEGTIHVDLFHGYAFAESGKVSRARKIARPFIVGSRRLAAASRNLTERLVFWEPAYPGLYRLIRSFYGSIRRSENPPISPEAALSVARTSDKILGS